MEQEPVAWMSQGGDVSRSKDYFEEMGFKDLIPLYTASKELSDEEIKAIELQISEGVACYDDFDFVAFARTILKKASKK